MRLNCRTSTIFIVNSVQLTLIIFWFQEFMLCKSELIDPRKCLNEGKAVTKCSLEFFRKVKSSCSREFTDYYTCIEKSSPGYELIP